MYNILQALLILLVRKKGIIGLGLFWFYGISSIVGYFMPNTIYSYILDIYDLQT